MHHRCLINYLTTIEMWGSVEGFFNANALTSTLMLPTSNRSITSVPIGQPAKPQKKLITPTTPAPFLKAIIKSEQQTVKDLLKTASRIGPVAQKVADKEAAYDAAFVTDTPANLPGAGISTLQGFTFTLFFGSYIIFMIVMTVFVNSTSNALAAGLTLVGLSILGVVILALVRRFG